MFNFFKRKEVDLSEAMTNQTIGGQSVLYKLFRDGIGCEDSSIRRLELTYLATAVTTFAYLLVGKNPNPREVLDSFTQNILSRSIPASGESISFSAAVEEYQGRYAEYNTMLPLLLNSSQSTTGNPAVTVLLHAVECITQSSARDRMLAIMAASGGHLE